MPRQFLKKASEFLTLALVGGAIFFGAHTAGDRIDAMTKNNTYGPIPQEELQQFAEFKLGVEYSCYTLTEFQKRIKTTDFTRLGSGMMIIPLEESTGDYNVVFEIWVDQYHHSMVVMNIVQDGGYSCIIGQVDHFKIDDWQGLFKTTPRNG